MLRAHADSLRAKSYALRTMYRVGAHRDEDGAEGVNTALRALMPWIFASDDSKTALFEDMMVDWYRAFGNLPPKAE